MTPTLMVRWYDSLASSFPSGPGTQPLAPRRPGTVRGTPGSFLVACARMWYDTAVLAADGSVSMLAGLEPDDYHGTTNQEPTEPANCRLRSSPLAPSSWRPQTPSLPPLAQMEQTDLQVLAGSGPGPNPNHCRFTATFSQETCQTCCRVSSRNNDADPV